MPEAGVSTRARRRTATPWWDELDREAFRFPTTYEAKPARRRSGGTAPVRAAVTMVPAEPVALREPGAPAELGLPAEPRTPAEPTAQAEPKARALVADRGPVASQRTPADGGRRTVVIRGHAADRNLPVARPRRHERPGFRPDRAALWAVILGLVLILVAAASAHAAMLH